jgi:outer membrane immunogenic protein
MTLAGTALAADLTPPPPPPIFTWTGLYIGGYGGGEVTHTSYDTLVGPPLSAFSHLTPTDIASVDAAGSQSLDKGGFAMGGELGYNWQIGMFVLGFETDIGGVTGGTNTTRAGLINAGSGPGVFFPFAISQRATNALFGTARGRLGIAFDRFLVYGTGGLAYLDIRLDHQSIQPEFHQLIRNIGVGAGVHGRVGLNCRFSWFAPPIVVAKY